MICEWCKSEFRSDVWYQKYCSRRCNRRASKKKYYAKYPEKQREERKRWRQRHKEEIKKYQDNYYLKLHHERQVAQWRANSALKWHLIGKKDECQDCKRKDVRLHKHHENYANGREVIWLCPKCHSKRHPKARIKYGELVSSSGK